MIRRGNSPRARIVIRADFALIELENEAFKDFTESLTGLDCDLEIDTMAAGHQYFKLGRVSYMSLDPVEK
tara:strand:+ start:1974 stop:2183 length:210 start_codon:yes stop_codon:yes gene_type:complete